MSAATGLSKGVKRLSELNSILAIALLLFVLLAGSTVFLLEAYLQNIGTYLGAVVQRTFRMYVYEPNAWLGDWTLFYWGVRQYCHLARPGGSGADCAYRGR